jgi:hypothetical protein
MHRSILTHAAPFAFKLFAGNTAALALMLIAGAAVSTTAAPVFFSTTLTDPLPDGALLVRAAIERMGGTRWKSIASFESIATAKSAMGDARIEYRFVAPQSHLLVQSMPGGRGVLEMGSTGGTAWMGEPGRARAVDPKMAAEIAGGGDLQTLVRSLEDRFDAFETKARESVDGKVVWTIMMTPRNSPTPDARWTLYLDATSGLVHGFEIPPPPKDTRTNAPTPTGQRIRLSRWESVEHPASTAEGDKLIAFRDATITAGGAETTLLYTKVAVDGLEKSAISPPVAIEPMPTAPASR